jgi:hypothetical protein
MAYNDKSFFSRIMLNVEKHVKENFFVNLFPVEPDEDPEQLIPDGGEETEEDKTPSTEEEPVDEGDQPIE